MSTVVPTTVGSASVLARGLLLISALGTSEGQTLTELSRATAIDKATALRLMRTLSLHGFVYRDASKRFWLGPMIAVLSRNFRLNEWLERAIQPELETLAKNTGETAAFFSDTNGSRLCLLAVNGWRDVGHQLRVGITLPMAGASGEALLRYAKGKPENYKTDIIVSLGQRAAELAAIATPIFDQSNNLLGALSLSGTKIRFETEGYIQSLRDELDCVAKEIHQKTGTSEHRM